MLFALLTLLAALSMAAVAGWFSIVGVMSIYAGSQLAAIVLGGVIEFGKLVMISSLFRNWKIFPWILKGPMLVAVIGIMIATSMSVFGYLSKAHLEQGVATIDNGPKIERLDEQIAREKSRISDDEKVISQLDATVNSFIGKDNGERALQVRRSQDSQRKQLRTDINSAQKSIDQLNSEKAPLSAEVRKLQLDVGPIRYIGELIFGDNNTEKNIELAVKLFSALIVLILDPSAAMLLIAFNHTIMRLENEKKEANPKTNTGGSTSTCSETPQEGDPPLRSENEEGLQEPVGMVETPVNLRTTETAESLPTKIPQEQTPEHKIDYVPYLSADDIIWPEIKFYEKKETVLASDNEGTQGRLDDEGRIQQSSVHVGQSPEGLQFLNECDNRMEIGATVDDKIQGEEPSSENVKENEINEEEKAIFQDLLSTSASNASLPVIRSPDPTRIDKRETTTIQQEGNLEESPKGTPIPLPQIGEIVAPVTQFIPQKVRNYRANLINEANRQNHQVPVPQPPKVDKYPKALSWLNEFKRSK